MNKDRNFVLSDLTKRYLGCNPSDLVPGSRKKVFIECSNCSDIRKVEWRDFIKWDSSLCFTCKFSKPEAEKSERKRNYIRNYQKRNRNGNLYLIHRLRVGIRSIFRRRSVNVRGLLRHLPYTATEFVEHINVLLHKYDFKCPGCNAEIYKFHIEHKKPVSLGTNFEEIIELFALENIDVLCAACNQSKSNKFDLTASEKEVIFTNGAKSAG